MATSSPSPTTTAEINVLFDLKTKEGEDIAILSTVILFFYVTTSLILYHIRGCLRTREDIQLFVTRSEKILHFIYVTLLIVFEITWTYGGGMRETTTTTTPNNVTLNNVTMWSIVNCLSLVFVIIAFFSKRYLRIYMYIAPLGHLYFFSCLIVERFARQIIDVDLLFPFMGATVVAALVVYAPPMFLMTDARVKEEKETWLKKNPNGSLYVPVAEMESPPANKDNLSDKNI